MGFINNCFAWMIHGRNGFFSACWPPLNHHIFGWNTVQRRFDSAASTFCFNHLVKCAGSWKLSQSLTPLLYLANRVCNQHLLCRA